MITTQSGPSNSQVLNIFWKVQYNASTYEWLLQLCNITHPLTFKILIRHLFVGKYVQITMDRFAISHSDLKLN